MSKNWPQLCNCCSHCTFSPDKWSCITESRSFRYTNMWRDDFSLDPFPRFLEQKKGEWVTAAWQESAVPMSLSRWFPSFVCPLLYPQIYQWKSSWGDSRRSAPAKFAWIRKSTSFLFLVDTWWFARSVPPRCANVPSAEALWKAPFAPSCPKYTSEVFENLFLWHIV